MLLRTVWAKDESFGAAIGVAELEVPFEMGELDLNLICVRLLGWSSLCSSPSARRSFCSVPSDVEVAWLRLSIYCLAVFSTAGVEYNDVDDLSPILGSGIMPGCYV